MRIRPESGIGQMAALVAPERPEPDPPLVGPEIRKDFCHDCAAAFRTLHGWSPQAPLLRRLRGGGCGLSRFLRPVTGQIDPCDKQQTQEQGQREEPCPDNPFHGVASSVRIRSGLIQIRRPIIDPKDRSAPLVNVSDCVPHGYCY
jgi:hypothetical protein